MRLIIGACVLLSSQLAWAAPPAAEERTLTQGVDRPIHDYSAEGDASSMDLNPALLTAAPALDIALLGYQTISEFARGSGFGAFIAANLRFGLAFGFGAQFIQPQLGKGVADFALDRNPSATKLTWAVAGGLGKKGAFGLAVHGIRSENEWLRRPDLDIGLLYRIRNYGSLGITARLGPGDLRDDDFSSQAALIAEVAVRPLGTRRLELAGGVRSVLAEALPGGELDRIGGTSGLFPRGRIALRHHGLALLGEVEQIGTTVLDAGTLQPLRTDKALRGSVAIELGWDMVRARAGMHAGAHGGVDGVGFEAHVSTTRNDRVYWPRRVDAERIELSEVTDERSLIEMLERLELARRAGDRAVLVVHPATKTGWATSHEIREALVRVRNAGGHVFAYLENASLQAYWVATAAEKIYMHPAGSLATYGIATTQFYFKDVLAKLGVQVEVVRIAEYKTAGESFTESGPTAPEREQEAAILADTYAQVLGDVARGRGMTRQRVRDLFDDSPHSPEVALGETLVDEIVFRDQLLDRVSDVIGAEVEFRRFADTRHGASTWADAPYVAVVLVEGTIIDGKSRFIPLIGLRFVGGDTIAETLRELRGDPACEGIVLRVNSGGGSALASDVMWREVQLTAEAHEKDPKMEPPIVVSMGDVAASGGYYVAMGTKPVLADPITVTGSIGVISIHPDLSGLLGKLGINAVTAKEGKNPDINAPWRPYTDDQRERIEASIASTYDLFRKRVAEGRDITVERVHELGRGHVYSGTDAKAAGLVDDLGGLHEALALVRKKAGTPRHIDLAIRVLPERLTLVELILDAIGVPRRSNEPNARAERRRARRGDGPTLRLPSTVDLSLAKLPLSLLFLEPGQAHAIAPWSVR
jgi:protease-4